MCEKEGEKKRIRRRKKRNEKKRKEKKDFQLSYWSFTFMLNLVVISFILTGDYSKRRSLEDCIYR